MPGIIRAVKISLAAVAAIVMLASVSSQSQAQTVRMHVTKVGFIVGVGGGNGTLTFHGRRYPFSVGGVGVGSLGIAGADLVGRAINLHRPGDIAGVYTAVGAGAAVAGGAQVARLQNANGVILELSGTQIGFQVSLGLSGMTITMR